MSRMTSALVQFAEAHLPLVRIVPFLENQRLATLPLELRAEILDSRRRDLYRLSSLAQGKGV